MPYMMRAALSILIARGGATACVDEKQEKRAIERLQSVGEGTSRGILFKRVS
jgi:hypothetical protein